MNWIKLKVLKIYFTLKLKFEEYYPTSSLCKVVLFIKFLLHRYAPQSFSIFHVKSNFKELLNLEPGDFLYASQEGKISRLKSSREIRLFRLKNFLVWGSLQARVEKSVRYTYMTFFLELYNPMEKERLLLFIERKCQLGMRALEKIKRINGKRTKWGNFLFNIEAFRRNSLVQEKVIQKMELAVKRQKEPQVCEEIKLAIKKGLFPLLVTTGLSGTYWMRGIEGEVLGLFKPFDEEAFAPNNPIGPMLQGSLGLRKMRPGIRVGESIHREVAAFVVDQFFGFGIVPKTYYATFTHHTFYQALSRKAEMDINLRRILKTKSGSFQEYIEGFNSLSNIVREDWPKIPEGEYQLLLIFDVIMGNMDRNTGNILVSEEKLAAIDHGLCLPDINLSLSDWYWSLEQGKKPLYNSFVQLFQEFPFEELSKVLRKKCFIDIRALERMRERLILFREGILTGLSPYELKGLFSDKNLHALYEYNATLEVKAKEIVENLRLEKTEEAS